MLCEVKWKRKDNHTSDKLSINRQTVYWFKGLSTPKVKNNTKIGNLVVSKLKMESKADVRAGACVIAIQP